MRSERLVQRLVITGYTLCILRNRVPDPEVPRVRQPQCRNTGGWAKGCRRTAVAMTELPACVSWSDNVRCPTESTECCCCLNLARAWVSGVMREGDKSATRDPVHHDSLVNQDDGIAGIRDRVWGTSSAERYARKK